MMRTYKSPDGKKYTVDCEYITDYIDLVLVDNIPHCVEQEQMIYNNVLPVLCREDVYIDIPKIEKGLSLQKYFPFELFPWETFCFALIAGVFYSDGTAFYKDIRIIIGRGNGKNGFISFLSFYFLSPYHGVRGYNIDILANSEDQAKTSFDDLYELIKAPYDSKFAKVLNSNYSATKTEIKGKKTNSVLRFNSSSGKGKDSKRSGAVIFDEKHEYESYNNISTLRSGLGKVQNGRLITITTDGRTRGGVLDKEKIQNADILKKYNPKNRTLVFYCHLENEDEYLNPKLWVKANPSVEYLPTLKAEIAEDIESMPYNPEYYPTFMAKRMNYIVSDGDAEVASWENILATNKEMIDLKGLPCVVGIDFAKTDDFVSALALFKKDGFYYAKVHGWVCRKSTDLRGIKAPLDEWEKRGLITFVNDVEIPAELIVNWIKKIKSEHTIKKIGIDNFRFSFLNTVLKKIGFDAYEKKNIKLIRPSDIMKASVNVNSVFVNQKLIVGDNPYFRWNVNNAKRCIDARGNTFYGKIEPHYRKTDAFMALVNALCLDEDLPEYKAPVVVPTFTF